MNQGNYLNFFRLQEDEKIIEAIKPLPVLKKMLFLTWIISWAIIFLLGFGWLFGIIMVLLSATIVGLFLPFFLLILTLIILFGLPYIFASLSYGKRYYWITNKRVISKQGLIGYSVNSIPLERISDVIISRSFWERIFGFGSLHVQTLAGQFSYNGRYGAEGNFQAVPDPEVLQEKIFKLIKEKRKTEHITM